jgi:hypothetical protein
MAMFKPITVKPSQHTAVTVTLDNGFVQLIHAGRNGDTQIVSMPNDVADALSVALAKAAAANRCQVPGCTCPGCDANR